MNETFEALTGELNRGLSCDVHDEEHGATWFMESKCPVCKWYATTAMCDTQYYFVVSNKNKAVINCLSCNNPFKPFDYFETTRRMN